MTGTTPPDFAKRLDATAEDTEALLGRLLSDDILPDEIARPKRLMDAMRYSSLNGGKRLRPFLVVESSAIFRCNSNNFYTNLLARVCSTRW